MTFFPESLILTRILPNRLEIAIPTVLSILNHPIEISEPTSTTLPEYSCAQTRKIATQNALKTRGLIFELATTTKQTCVACPARATVLHARI